MVGILCTVIATFGLYLMSAGNLEIEEILLMIIPIILVGSVAYIIYDRIKNMKAGLPVADERLKLIGYKAGNYGFIAAIWSAVGTPLLASILFDYELPGNYVTASVVLFSGLVFIVSYLYLASRGITE